MNFTSFLSGRPATRRAATFGLTLLAALAVGVIALPATVHAQGTFNNAKPLRIGLAASPANDAVRLVAKKAEAEGLKVEIIEFNDWITPNTALAEGSIDVNYFQHIPFLEDVKSAKGYDLKAVAPGYITWLGIYSERVKRLEDVKDGATVAFANDPVNTGRALRLLDDVGLIKLKDGSDFRATVRDVVGNPKHLKLVAVEAQHVARALADVDLAVTFPSFVKLAGKDPNSAIVYQKPQKLYAIHWVTRTADANDPRLKRFIELYDTTPEVKDILRKQYGELIAFAW
jgi:D-methionine transport system substrate-binding protein